MNEPYFRRRELSSTSCTVAIMKKYVSFRFLLERSCNRNMAATRETKKSTWCAAGIAPKSIFRLVKRKKLCKKCFAEVYRYENMDRFFPTLRSHAYDVDFPVARWKSFKATRNRKLLSQSNLLLNSIPLMHPCTEVSDEMSSRKPIFRKGNWSNELTLIV